VLYSVGEQSLCGRDSQMDSADSFSGIGITSAMGFQFLTDNADTARNELIKLCKLALPAIVQSSSTMAVTVTDQAS
jgi:hypothetical protein